MDEPRYHLGSVVHAKGETLEDFDGPLDVILLLLSKNKIEIQDIQISAILEQYLAYLDEMKRMAACLTCRLDVVCPNRSGGMMQPAKAAHGAFLARRKLAASGSSRAPCAFPNLRCDPRC